MTHTSMRIRTLGAAGMRVSELCLGTMMFGDQTDEAEARRIVDHAASQGVNFIDSADQYAAGRSEEITGRLIKGSALGTGCWRQKPAIRWGQRRSTKASRAAMSWPPAKPA